MDWQVEKEAVRTLAQEVVGMDVVGFTTAEAFTYIEERLREAEDLGQTSGFEHHNIKERLSPSKHLAEASSIISFAIAYPAKPLYERDHEVGERRGQFARASWGEDYHSVLHRYAKKLVERLTERYADLEALTMVDTGALGDVAVAERAGVGFRGKNGLIITEEFGSYVYLGEIITNLPFPPDERLPDGCGDCTRCIDFCPTGALLGDGRMNAQVCLSYLTQTKGYIPEKYRRLVGTQLYGCDICQQVCPYNQGIDSHYHPALEPSREQVEPELQPMLTMSNREFREKFGSLAGAWRGKKPLQRNAILALANYRDRTAMPLLIRLMEEDPRPVIRGTAAYALSLIERYQNEALEEAVSGQLEKEEGQDEPDSETVLEFQKALERLQKKRPKRKRRRK